MRDIKFRYYVINEDRTIVKKDFSIEDIEDMNFNTKLLKDFEITSKNLKDTALFRSQYVGIKDKNGKDIYCNDIVINTFLDKHIFLPDTITECAINGFYNYNESTYIVIGNIYEHSHLVDNN